MNLLEFKTFFTEYQGKRGWEKWTNKTYETVYEYNHLDKMTPPTLQEFEKYITVTAKWPWDNSTGGAKFTEAYETFRATRSDLNASRYTRPHSGSCSRRGCGDGLLAVVYFYNNNELVKVMPCIPNFREPPGRFADMRAETGAIRCDCVGPERYTSFKSIGSYGHLWGE